MNIHKNAKLGKNCIIQENVFVGLPSREYLKKSEEEWPPTEIGDNVVLRSGTVIYCDVAIGKNFQTGHNALIRERTVIGDNVLVGTNAGIDGYTKIGNNVSIQSSVCIPMNTIIADNVFIGPNAVLTNDKHPIRKKSELRGPVLRKGVSIGANATILPGLEIGEGAMVGAGSVVTKDVPSWKLAIGAPAKIKDLPPGLKILNRLGD